MRKRDSVAKGAMFTVAMRLSDRVLGLASTIILARLLVPADFGIIAMASLVIGFADAFLDLGVNVALIQHANATKALYNAAWTLRLVQTAVGTLAVVLCAPLAAIYFHDVRIEPVLAAMAFTLLLSGLENIWVIEFQKEMQFARDFRFMVTKRVFGFIITIIAAWWLRSYWALVVGSLVGRSFGVLYSYIVHRERPRFSFHSAREIFGVSQWVLVRSIGGFLEVNLHKWVVGGREPAAVMGAYTLADDISSLPPSMLLLPLNRVLFPAFAAARHDLVELKRIFLLAQGVQALLGIPASVGLMLVADEAVRLLLGEKWSSAVPYVQLLALTGAVSAVVTSGGYAMIVLGQLRMIAVFSWIRVGLFAFIMYVLFPGAGALEVAWLRAIFLVVVLAVFLFRIKAALPDLRLRDIAASVGRPVLAVVVMAACVLALGRIGWSTLTGALVAKVAVGALTYGITLGGLWWLTGRPVGAESYLLEKAGLKRWLP